MPWSFTYTIVQITEYIFFLYEYCCEEVKQLIHLLGEMKLVIQWCGKDIADKAWNYGADGRQ